MASRSAGYFATGRVWFQVPYLACLTAGQVGVRMGCLHSTALSFNIIKKVSRASQIRLEYLADKNCYRVFIPSDSGNFSLQVLSTIPNVFSEIYCAAPVGLAAGSWCRQPQH
jgi:hypothetical protein